MPCAPVQATVAQQEHFEATLIMPEDYEDVDEALLLEAASMSYEAQTPKTNGRRLPFPDDAVALKLKAAHKSPFKIPSLPNLSSRSDR